MASHICPNIRLINRKRRRDSSCVPAVDASRYGFGGVLSGELGPGKSDDGVGPLLRADVIRCGNAARGVAPAISGSAVSTDRGMGANEAVGCMSELALCDMSRACSSQ